MACLRNGKCTNSCDIFTDILYFISSNKDKKINYWLAIIVFFSTISRLDSVYHISILLVVFSLYWYFFIHEFKAFYFSFFVFILWIFFQLWRYYYFGDILPNTAYAQNISVKDRLELLLQLDKEYIHQSMNLGREIFLNHAGWLLLIIPLLFVYVKKSVELWFSTLLVLSIILSSYFNPFIFGATRLDHNRSTTQMILFVVLLVGLYFYHIKSNKVKGILFVICVIPSFWYYTKLGYHTKPLCCNTKSFDKTRINFEEVSMNQDIKTPTVSSPDLGVLSWYKKFNIIDIGRLGTPIMAHINGDRELFKKYYLEYALPDIIELHNGWSCGYGFLLNDGKFKNLYRPISTHITKWTTDHCTEYPLSKSGIWIRKNIEKNSISKERNFLNKLQKNISLNTIEEEFKQCEMAKHCDYKYIARILYHVLPEIKEKGIYKDILSIGLRYSLDPYSLYLLTGFSNPIGYQNTLKYINANIGE